MAPLTALISSLHPWILPRQHKVSAWAQSEPTPSRAISSKALSAAALVGPRACRCAAKWGSGT